MKHPTSIARRDGGSALILVLGYLVVVTVLGAAFFVGVHRAINASMTREHHAVCLYLAEGGLDKAIAEVLAHLDNYTGESETRLGDGYFSTTIEGVPSSGRFSVVATSRLGGQDSVLARARLRADVGVEAGRVVSLAWREERVR